MGKITAAITGVGAYLPDYILDNDELSRMVDTSDEWIMSRIGIKTRHILKGDGLGTSYMGSKAVIDLLEKTNVDPADIDLVICATVTPDMMFPSTGNLIAYKSGCRNAFAYDVSAACCGFLFALTTASKFIETYCFFSLHGSFGESSETIRKVKPPMMPWSSMFPSATPRPRK